jgi:hypothetical protein
MTKPKYMGGLGFRDTKLLNLALLDRQAWRVLQDPNTPSAWILKAINFPTTDFPNAHLGSRPSQIWRALVEGRQLAARVFDNMVKEWLLWISCRRRGGQLGDFG